MYVYDGLRTATAGLEGTVGTKRFMTAATEWPEHVELAGEHGIRGTIVPSRGLHEAVSRERGLAGTRRCLIDMTEYLRIWMSRSGWRC